MELKCAVSIIIPCYNGEKTIALLLDSLTDQTKQGDEIIVVDDGSTDHSPRLARDWGAKVLLTGGRKGPAVARNIGAKNAMNDVLLFLDSDVIAPAHLVAHVKSRFDAEPDLPALSGLYDPQPANNGFFHHIKAAQCRVWFEGRTEYESLETACAAIRRDLFWELGGFDETYLGADVEDFEFGYRLGRAIELDHEMKVLHHFPSFTTNLKNYFWRSFEWARLFRKRKKFDSAATTSQTAAGVMLAPAFVVTALVAWVAGMTGLWWIAIPLLLGWIAGKLPVLNVLRQNQGFLKTTLALPILFTGDLAVFLGAGFGLVTP